MTDTTPLADLSTERLIAELSAKTNTVLHAQAQEETAARLLAIRQERVGAAEKAWYPYAAEVHRRLGAELDNWQPDDVVPSTQASDTASDEAVK